MIEHSEALKKIKKHSKPLEMRHAPLEQAYRRVLAEDLFSAVDIPGFDNAAVDGYAVGQMPALNDCLNLNGEIKAGDGPRRIRLRQGACRRVFTGASVPHRVWAVVMQENVIRENGHIKILKRPQAGENIRRQGEDVRQGERLLKKGTLLEPQHIGLLASAGFKEVPVIRQPVVSILATGSEIVMPGNPLTAGKIYDSNTPMLEALVRDAGCQPKVLRHGRDHKRALRGKICKGLQSDVLLVAGGVSVGKYDFVKELLADLGVMPVFWKINIKPGKPLYFGIKNKTLVFGLPGNPVSVFITFNEYVRPLLQRLQGKPVENRMQKAVLEKDCFNGPRRYFMRVKTVISPQGEIKVKPLGSQGSHCIGSLARTHATLEIPPSLHLRQGDSVSVKMISERS